MNPATEQIAVQRAFPFGHQWGSYGTHLGLSFRELTAIHALQGILASPHAGVVSDTAGVATVAVECADALCAALAAKPITSASS